MKADELLKVLDMTEEEQRKQLPFLLDKKAKEHKIATDPNQHSRCLVCDKGYSNLEEYKKFKKQHPTCSPFPYRKSLADLAFRLRDEAVARQDGTWCEAEHEVYLYLEKDKQGWDLDTWFVMEAEPIHWIITAIRAKELANGKKE